MRLTLLKVEPVEAGFERLRVAPLEKTGERVVYPCLNATMRLGEFLPLELNHISLYVLESHLNLQREFRLYLMGAYQIDTLRLSGIYFFRDEEDEGHRIWALYPPIVFIYEEEVKILPQAGELSAPDTSLLRIPVIHDGIHRAWLAKEDSSALRCIVICGFRGYRLYAFPNSWSQVKVYNDLVGEKPPLKKFYRREPNYSFMLALNSALGRYEGMPQLIEYDRSI